METEAPPQPTRRPLWQSFLVGRKPAWTVLRILFVVFISIVLFKFVLLPVRVTGSSMFPTYQNGQIRLVNRLAYWKKEPERGDIVAIQFLGREILLIKRVIGLPGEMMQVVDGRVHINGERLVEPYAHGIISAEVKDEWGQGHLIRTSIKFTIPEGYYFLVGDNRNVSEIHLEPRRKMLGKLLF